MLMGGIVNSMDDGGAGLWLQTACVSNQDITGNQVRRVPFKKSILIVNFAGANNSTVFIDSAENNPITAYGNAKIQTAGGQYGLFDGAGDYLSVARGAGWGLGSEFTIECFVSFASTAYQCLVGQWEGVTGSNNAWVLQYLAGNLYFTFSSSGVVLYNRFVSFTPTIGQRYYLVAEQEATPYFRFYIDGATVFAENSPSSIYASSNQDLQIGKLNGYSADFDGKMFGIRISPIARYAKDGFITVPSLPFN